MRKIFTNQVIIALITVIGLVFLYLGLNYMKGVNVFRPANQYYVLMPNVSELQTSSPVFVDGFRVGIVSAIKFDFSDPDRKNVAVQISLDKNMKIQTGSYAELKSSLTSGASLDLKLNKYVGTYCQIGDTIEGICGVSLMNKFNQVLFPQIENILPLLDSVLLGIQMLINHPALHQSLCYIEETTNNLQKSSVQLNNLLTEDVPVIVANLNRITSDFSVVSGNLKQIEVQRTLWVIEEAIYNINRMTEQFNNPDNSLGLLLNDRSLYDRLDSTAQNASNLLLDIKESPKRYVHFSIF